MIEKPYLPRDYIIKPSLTGSKKKDGSDYLIFLVGLVVALIE